MIKVDVWSDIACPWCYIGTRRFAEGVRRYRATGGTEPVEIEYHSFELSPDTPVDFEGDEVAFLSRHKGIPEDDARRMLEQMTALAASEGLTYDFAALRHTNTRRAHELLHLAKADGVQPAMKERLLRAYFGEGRHLGRVDELVALAADVGIDAERARHALEGGVHAADVDADIDQAHALGIHGVPFYVVDGRFGVSGAQDPDVFAQALHRAASAG